MHLYCNFKVQERNRNIKSQNWSLHLLSQAAGENARPTCISVAAASVWTPAWRVTASPTVPTDQMRVQDVLNATAPAPQLLSVTSTVSAPQMARSVLNRCACVFVFFAALSQTEPLYRFRGMASKHKFCLLHICLSLLDNCISTFWLYLNVHQALPCSAWKYPFSSFLQRCYCAAGFRLHSSALSCVDIDECNEMPHAVCKHTCLNTPGSYICHCYPDFYLAPDKKSCKTKGNVSIL